MKTMLMLIIPASAGQAESYIIEWLRRRRLPGWKDRDGLIGTYANPQPMDGATLTVPFLKFFDTNNNWSMENEGV